jgi:pilus assembly protein CpaC
MRDFRFTLLAAAAFCTLAPMAAPPGFGPQALAQEQPPPKPTQHGTITVSAGSGRVIHLDDNASNVFTADPKVAEVRPASANSLFVFGVAPGSTTVAAMGGSGNAVGQFQIVVVPSSFDAGMASAAIRRDEPRGTVRTRGMETGVGLSGSVATPEDAERAVVDAKGVLPPDGKVINRLHVGEGVQVSLHVRVAEMTRTLVRELGVNWQGQINLGKGVQSGTTGASGLIGGNLVGTLADTALTPSAAGFTLGGLATRGWDLSATIDALSNDQLVHTLAEPNLTAMSGETASFLVGGEFPIPVATSGSSNTISVDFKQYGISLAFVPTVLSHDRINLHVRPEVSELDKADGVTSYFGGSNSLAINIPALTVRRAETTVELGSGQSFVIAGLLSDQATLTKNGVPGLSDVPMLGALFSSDGFQRQQTELVIVVTPYIVKPVSDPNALHLPTDGWHAPNDIERIIYLRQLGSGTAGNGTHPHIPADAGFMVE